MNPQDGRQTCSLIHQRWEVRSFRSSLQPTQPQMHPNRLPMRTVLFCVDWKTKNSTSVHSMRMESPLNQRLRWSPPDVVYTPIDITSRQPTNYNGLSVAGRPSVEYPAHDNGQRSVIAAPTLATVAAAASLLFVASPATANGVTFPIADGVSGPYEYEVGVGPFSPLRTAPVGRRNPGSGRQPCH